MCLVQRCQTVNLTKPLPIGRSIFLRLRDRDTGTSRARESLDSHNLEVVGVTEPVLRPVIEVVANSNGARGAFALTN